MQATATVLALALACSSATAQVAGAFDVSGEGCPDASLLYEVFAPGAFDLSTTPSLDWLPNAGLGFIVLRGLTSALPTTGGTALPLGDDAVSMPQNLGFTFPYPTGARSTTTVDVSSNGFVYLEPGAIQSSRCCNATAAILRAFRNDAPSWAVLGMDLDPGASGTVWFNTAPGLAWITWDQVPENGQVNLNTFQIQFHASGQVSIIWSSAGNTTHSALVGWSGGFGVDDDGPIDFSAQPAWDMGASSGPLTISAPPARLPTLGRTFRIDMQNVPSDALLGVLLLATTATNVDLSSQGMPGCWLFVSPDLPSFPTVIAPPTGQVVMPIPNAAPFLGLVLESQLATVARSVNQLGVSTSNRGRIRIGNIDPIIVRAQGTDNLNDDVASGFWQVINATSLDITSLRFSWLGSSIPNTNYFDTNQTGMADRFDGGNSQTPLCAGTYRNDSANLVALDYTNTNATPCGANSRTGWVGSNFGSSAGDYKTLDFRFNGFTSGKVFEFDADTDGGPGNGGAMAGMVVRVQLSDNSVRTGELVMINQELAVVNL